MLNTPKIHTPDRMAPVPADALIGAVCSRDFAAMRRLLTSETRMRAVLPSRYVDAVGDEIVGWFTRWFGSCDRFDVVDAGASDFGGRARIHWQFRVDAHPGTGAPGPHEIEQLAFCDASAGLIARIDLVCSGFRPLPNGCV